MSSELDFKKQMVRVACVQYQQRGLTTFAEFVEQVTYFVAIAADYKCDFVCFPEFLTLQLLSIAREKLMPEQAITRLSDYTAELETLFVHLACKYQVNLLAGTHLQRQSEGKIYNVALVYLRDGSVHHQAKIHATPSERFGWKIAGGNSLKAIDTDCGPVGILICYDAEFPELARHLIEQRVGILFIPSCTDERQGYLRVRYAAQARAIENQCYVAMVGNVGSLPRVEGMDIQYAQSCILTPCDFGFARDGIAAEASVNIEQIVFADLNMQLLAQARQEGTVQNLRDRRHDLYRVLWHEQSEL